MSQILEGLVTQRARSVGARRPMLFHFWLFLVRCHKMSSKMLEGLVTQRARSVGTRRPIVVSLLVVSCALS